MKNKFWIRVFKFFLLIILLIDFAVAALYELDFRQIAFISVLIVGCIFFLLKKINCIDKDDVLEDTLNEWDVETESRGEDDFFNSRLLVLTILMMIISDLLSYVLEMTFWKLAIALIILASLIYGFYYLIK